MVAELRSVTMEQIQMEQIHSVTMEKMHSFIVLHSLAVKADWLLASWSCGDKYASWSCGDNSISFTQPVPTLTTPTSRQL